MRKLHKGLLIGGVTLAVLVPAGFVAADQMENGNGNGNGRGNGDMTHDGTCDQTGTQATLQERARDGSGTPQGVNGAPVTAQHQYQDQSQAQHQDQVENQNQNQSGPADGTGNQWRSGR